MDRYAETDRFSEIIARFFSDPTPCSGCRCILPTYRDAETGRALCVECLEEAVTESQAELLAERQDTARLCACFGQLAI